MGAQTTVFKKIYDRLQQLEEQAEAKREDGYQYQKPKLKTQTKNQKPNTQNQNATPKSRNPIFQVGGFGFGVWVFGFWFWFLVLCLVLFIKIIECWTLEATLLTNYTRAFKIWSPKPFFKYIGFGVLGFEIWVLELGFGFGVLGLGFGFWQKCCFSQSQRQHY